MAKNTKKTFEKNNNTLLILEKSKYVICTYTHCQVQNQKFFDFPFMHMRGVLQPLLQKNKNMFDFNYLEIVVHFYSVFRAPMKYSHS